MKDSLHPLVSALLIPLLCIACADRNARWQGSVPQRNAANFAGPIGLAINPKAQVDVPVGVGKLGGAGGGAGNAVGAAAAGMPKIDHPIGLLIVVPILAGAAIGGAIYGASKAPSKNMKRLAAHQVSEEILRADIPKKLLTAIDTRLGASFGPSLLMLDPAAARPTNLSAVLEIDALNVGLTEDEALENETCLFLEARTTLRSTATDEAVHQMWWRYIGDSRNYTYSPGYLVRDQTDRLAARLADDLAEEVFLKALPETSGEFLGLAPIEPKPSARILSRQPMLKWAPYTGAAEVSNITYELKVWTQLPGAPRPEVVYHKENLAECEHRIVRPLSEGRLHHWSVRAHFLRNGRPAISSWGQIRPFASRNPTDRWVGPLDLNLLYKFRTPEK